MCVCLCKEFDTPWQFLNQLPQRIAVVITWHSDPPPSISKCWANLTFPSLHLRRNSFSNPSVALPTPQLILQPFRCFTYDTVLSPTLISLLLRNWLFTYVTWRAAQLILQPFRRFTYVTAHSPTLPSLYLRHSSFSNPSVASPTSQVLHLCHLASRPCLDNN